MSPRILIIEDDKNIQKLLQINFAQENFEVLQAFDGTQGLKMTEELRPDLVILDINLPKINGLEVCKSLKNNTQTRYIPIIILTVRKDKIDRVLGFEIGVDDYVTKPFSPRELILRTRAVLRRKIEPKITPKIKVGEIVLDEETFEVEAAAKSISLTATEFKLLKYFLLHQNRLLSRDNILHNVWGYTTEIDTRTVDAHIKSLRKKLPATKTKIVTVIGMGYKLVSNV